MRTFDAQEEMSQHLVKWNVGIITLQLRNDKLCVIRNFTVIVVTQNDKT